MIDRFKFFSQYRGLRPEIYVLFFGRVVTNLGSMVWPMITMIMSQKLGLSASRIALVMVLSGCIMVPANLVGGKLADKFNKKNNIVLFDIISVACYIACSFTHISIATIVLMLIAGICQSLEWPSYNALIADLTSTADRERAYSLEYLGANLGLVLSPTLAGLLFKNYLWLSFLISGIAIGCSTVLIALKIRDINPVEDNAEESVYQKQRSGESILTILKENKVVMLFTVAISLYYCAYHQYTYLMPLDMGRIHGEDGAAIYGTVSSLNCIIVVIFTPIITRIFSNIINTKKILLGEFLVCAGYAIFLIFMERMAIYYFAMILFTWGEIFTTISEGPYTSTRIPASHRGRINGISSVLGFAFQSGIELGTGSLYDSKGSSAAWTLVFTVLAAAMVLTLLIIKLDKKAYPALYASGSAQNSDNS